MCDDQSSEPNHGHAGSALSVRPDAVEGASPRGVSRRDVLRGLAGLTGGLAFAGVGWQEAAAALDTGPVSPCSMAMHLHGPYSEGAGSLDGHLAQATAAGVDVVWWTDHDQRMEQRNYRSVVHFTSLTSETTDGGAWQWKRRVAGPLATASAGGIVQSPSSPNDPIAGGSLFVSAQSSGAGTASLGYYADPSRANANYRGNLHGQTLSIEVLLPSAVSASGYLELLINSSNHTPSGGRPAGMYSLSYRFGAVGAPGPSATQGLMGIINVPITPGTWNTVSVTPYDDIVALWPEMQADDFASYGLTLRAVSNGAMVKGYVDYLRFTRQYLSDDIPLQRQQAMMAPYTDRYPGVLQQQGLEISGGTIHANWFGPGVTLPDYTGVTAGSYPGFVADEVASIHAAGGVASYNHPFGTAPKPLLSTATQDSLVSATASSLLGNDVLGCDILEVGYQIRGGCDLAHHVAVWDVLSGNGRFLTGNGVSDDHVGTNWSGSTNNWFTSVWAATKSMGDLVAALRAGRAWTASLSRFRGTLDLMADGTCPMGSVSVSAVDQRALTVLATGLPTGGSVEVLRGGVTYAGTTTPSPQVVAQYASTAFLAGSVAVPIDTSTSCFVRTLVRDSQGKVIALSNPIWLLREQPPGGVPVERAA